MQQKWIRGGGVALLDHLDTLTVIGRDGLARQFSAASAELARVALDFWCSPRTEEEFAAHLRERGGEFAATLVGEVTKVLGQTGALVQFSDGPGVAPVAGGRILVGVSGAIAAIDATSLVRILLARGFEVEVAITRSARKFVTPEALASLTHRPVSQGFWGGEPTRPAPHIRLAEWADLIAIFPATASTIARIATGSCTDVLSAAVAASHCPVLIVPSMNEGMYRSPAVQRNLEQLRSDGRHVAQPDLGYEVASPPRARTPILGPAPGPSTVAAMIEFVWRSSEPRRDPSTAEQWDRQYATSRLEQLPWFAAEADRDLADRLAEIAASSPGKRLLEIGTGPGTIAICAAQLGFDVVATDRSAQALVIARRRAGALPIAWVIDDILASRLWGRFDIVVDRGCLHCIPGARQPDYANAVARLAAPGGLLLLKSHAPVESGRHGTYPLRPEELERLFREHFTIEAVFQSQFDGALKPAPRAVLTLLRRSGGSG